MRVEPIIDPDGSPADDDDQEGAEGIDL